MSAYSKIILTLVFGIGLTMVFNYFLQKGAGLYHVHRMERVNEIFHEHTAYDILFIGSSRTHISVYPRVIDSVTGMKSYNAGEDGAVIYEFKKRLDGFLVNHPAPAYVVLTLDATSLDSNKKLFFPLQYFDMTDNPVVSETLQELPGYKMCFIRDLPFMRVIYYDDYAKKRALSGWFHNTELNLTNRFRNNGFLSNGYACTDTVLSYASTSSPAVIQPDGLAFLRSIIDTCKAKKITLILTYAPEYRFRFQESISNFPVFTNTVKNIADNAGISFYRDDSLSICNDRCLFANYGHLNTPGAIEYSKILGKRILALSQNNNSKE
jgi:hypothetical protein